MKSIYILFVTWVFLIAGCATGYQPTGFTGGYSETRLAPDVVRVVFLGNGYTGKERSQNFALLRGAELTVAAGFQFFRVLSENTDKSAYSFTTGGSSYTTGSAYAVGNQVNYTARTNYIPGQTMTFYKPETGLLIQFVGEKPQDGFAFDAAFLIKNLREKYNIK
jgi:hypothetical protein